VKKMFLRLNSGLLEAAFWHHMADDHELIVPPRLLEHLPNVLRRT
jgi:hypothetical protein